MGIMAIHANTFQPISGLQRLFKPTDVTPSIHFGTTSPDDVSDSFVPAINDVTPGRFKWDFTKTLQSLADNNKAPAYDTCKSYLDTICLLRKTQAEPDKKNSKPWQEAFRELDSIIDKPWKRLVAGLKASDAVSFFFTYQRDLNDSMTAALAEKILHGPSKDLQSILTHYQGRFQKSQEELEHVASSKDTNSKKALCNFFGTYADTWKTQQLSELMKRPDNHKWNSLFETILKEERLNWDIAIKAIPLRTLQAAQQLLNKTYADAESIPLYSMLQARIDAKQA